jgi:uncharacterized repeat protein (TIGR03803 family)
MVVRTATEPVFKVTTAGTESVLHRFGSGSDGKQPEAGLTNINDAFYGTTVAGGTKGYGTIFRITTSRTESILHSFGGGNDGLYPLAGLTNVNGVLYGATGNGGLEYRTGTIFEITTAGAKSTLYDFAGGSDGRAAWTNLTYVNKCSMGRL